MTAPARPKIFHITHIDNLASIIGGGFLLSDAAMVSLGGPKATIGMSNIKSRRLALPVPCRPGTRVGDYVPFYFCPRSVMLYLIYKGNHPELGYRGGQGRVLTLEADLRATVAWAEANERRWAFSLSNAGAGYAEFRSSLAQLDEIEWSAVASSDFRSADVKEGKQAEFLMHERFPWSLVTSVGAASLAVRNEAATIIAGADHEPPVNVRLDWYY